VVGGDQQHRTEHCHPIAGQDAQRAVPGVDAKGLRVRSPVVSNEERAREEEPAQEEEDRDTDVQAREHTRVRPADRGPRLEPDVGQDHEQGCKRAVAVERVEPSRARGMLGDAV
jgi:hypothetical protein